MWLCLACNRTFESNSVSPSCPECRCIGVVPVTELEGDTLEQQDLFESPNHLNCKENSICFGKPASAYGGVPSGPIGTKTISFHDLDINELVLIAETPSKGYDNPAIITEMQERFLHTFLDDCSCIR